MRYMVGAIEIAFVAKAEREWFCLGRIAPDAYDLLGVGVVKQIFAGVNAERTATT